MYLLTCVHNILCLPVYTGGLWTFSLWPVGMFTGVTSNLVLPPLINSLQHSVESDNGEELARNLQQEEAQQILQQQLQLQKDREMAEALETQMEHQEAVSTNNVSSLFSTCI